MRRKIACLITGVPRGYERCFTSLRFLLGECDVTYFAVIREEFATDDTVARLHQQVPGLRLVVVPRAETEAALARPRGALMGTVVQMWHEVWYGNCAIENRDSFDFILRTRFDLFFHRQYLPEPAGEAAGTVWLPEQLSWSGSNDMVCLARPREFAAYTTTYDKLASIAEEGAAAPEGVLMRALAVSGLAEEKLDVLFILYREALFAGLSDVQLQVLAQVHPALSVYKLGAPGDSEERRRECVALAHSLTLAESTMPVFEAANVGQQFGAPEVDQRDASSYRWIGMHAQARRALAAGTREIRFTIHHHVAGWTIDHLRVAVDGNAVALRVVGRDAFGRLQVSGTIEPLRRLRRPWSRITFYSDFSAVPSETGANPDDHRTLSAALGAFDFVEDAQDAEDHGERSAGGWLMRPLRGIRQAVASSLGSGGGAPSGGRDAQ